MHQHRQMEFPVSEGSKVITTLPRTYTQQQGTTDHPLPSISEFINPAAFQNQRKLADKAEMIAQHPEPGAKLDQHANSHAKLDSHHALLIEKTPLPTNQQSTRHPGLIRRLPLPSRVSRDPLETQRTSAVMHSSQQTGQNIPLTSRREGSMFKKPRQEFDWMEANCSRGSLPPESLRQHSISGRWKCLKKIGSGSFGDTYLALEMETGRKVAVKVEALKARHPQLLHEAKILRSMQGCAGFPQLFYFGVHQNLHSVIVMELLGPTLEEVFHRWGQKKFSLPTTALIGAQMIDRLEALHLQGIIHRDVKPDNFLIGLESNANKIYCIDFGLAKRFWDAKSKCHMAYSDRRSLTGTARYASINAHVGIEPARRDDLTSVGYSLVYFAKRGLLPWQGLKANTKEEKYNKIMERKIQTTFDQLASGLPDIFWKFLQHCRDLRFEEAPNYNYLRQLLTTLVLDRRPTLLQSSSQSSGLWSPYKTGLNSKECDTADTLRKSWNDEKGGNDFMMEFQSGLERNHFEVSKGFDVGQDGGQTFREATRAAQVPLFIPEEDAHLLRFKRQLDSRPKKGKTAVFCMTCAKKSNSISE